MPKPPRRKTILITAGPTIEPLDPVRYLSNYSTGMMGYELAKAAGKRGYRVVLISGPTSIEAPGGVKFVAVNTAIEMKKAVLAHFRAADCVIMAAAVSDFRPAVSRKNKIKKCAGKTLFLKLVRNPDILAALGRIKKKRILIGYSLETENALKNAKSKLRAKHMDAIVINSIDKKSDPFGPGGKAVAIMDKKGDIVRLRGVQKGKIAQILLDKLQTLW